MAYIGELETIFPAVARVLRRRGLFAFTAERSDDPGDRLGERHRFAHHALYVAGQAAAAGFEVVSRSEEHTSELQSLMRTPYAVSRLKKKINNAKNTHINYKE